MSGGEPISRLILSAQRSSHEGLFAGFQVAVVKLIDASHGQPITDADFDQIERAIKEPQAPTRRLPT